MIVGLHHGPCNLYMHFHATDNDTNEIHYFDDILEMVGIIIPLGFL